MLFFFDIRDGDELIEDPDGSDFVDLDAAVEDATIAARELLATALLAGKPLGDRRFEIRDQSGARLVELPFRAAIPPG